MLVEVGAMGLVVEVVETNEMVDDTDVVSEEIDKVATVDEVDTVEMVDELDRDVEDETVPCCWYTFRRDPAPQY
jgi:hypothetical protein